MAGYKEIVEDYRFELTTNSQSGSRSFYKQADGTASLPELGDEFNSTYKECLARRIVAKKFFPDPDDRTKWIEKNDVEYTTRGNSDVLVIDPDERRYQLGTEVITVDTPPNWKWELKKDDLTQPLYLTNIVGSFTRQRELNSTSAKESWLTDKVEGLSGCINDAKFEGHRIGSVLFDGVSGGTQYDKDGTLVWVFEMQFTYRLIRSGPSSAPDKKGNVYPINYNGVNIIKDDWLYLWNKKASASGHGAWDKPIDLDDRFLYSKVNFNDLF